MVHSIFAFSDYSFVLGYVFWTHCTYIYTMNGWFMVVKCVSFDIVYSYLFVMIILPWVMNNWHTWQQLFSFITLNCYSNITYQILCLYSRKCFSLNLFCAIVGYFRQKVCDNFISFFSELLHTQRSRRSKVWIIVGVLKVSEFF